MTIPLTNDEEQPLLVSKSKDSTVAPCYDTAGSSSSSSENHGNGSNQHHDQDCWEPVSAPTSPMGRSSQQQQQHDGNDPPFAVVITKGHIMLFLVAISYGSLNVALRGVYGLPDPPSPSALSTIRGWMAVVCFVPFLLHQQRQRHRQPEELSLVATAVATIKNTNNDGHVSLLTVALELAVWNFGAQALINIGLLYIPSARAAFFTQLSVVMTPALATLSGHRLHFNVGIACFIALMGLVLLSKKTAAGTDAAAASNGISGGEFTLGFGDVVTLCGALSWSTYIYRLSAVGDRYDNVQLQAWKNVILASLYTAWCLVEFAVHGQSPWLNWQNAGIAWALLFYSALGPGCIADVLQQQGQATVSATVSNIILSLEPVFTAIFGRLLLGELTSGLEKIGGCLILTAAVVATLGQD